ncbi:hypothetical protein [Flavivirga eckloniae]|uniref:Uncharacterized protein n=1 Tax=Flavivirga eckloniae TaxID=1803846 RepID=A0A2K9PNF8_9FLAO|nr:hypothetical protein [Flavivirga eckloniae]AUP78601.1 hypothetical protein C1H87_07700 [Flavivirga eckloniae]
MKKYFILIGLIALCSLASFAQDHTINFAIKNAKLSTQNLPENELALPIKMVFPKIFKGKTIELRYKDNRVIYKGTFGTDIKTIGESTNYNVVINKNRDIVAVVDPGTKNINEDASSFTVNLGNNRANKFEIKISNTNSQDINQVAKNKEEHKPGYLLHDAIYINENLKPGQPNNTIAKILKYYDIDKTNISDNKYLNEQLKDVFQVDGSVQGADESGVDGLISTIGGANVTTIADGFAKFIVKRTKQELTIEFFSRFQEKLDESEDLQSVFPQTYRSLSAIGEEIYMFEAYIQTLRQAFEKDLKTLPANLPHIIDNHATFFNERPELKAGLLTSFYIAESFQEKQHPGVIIENYKHELWDDTKNPNYKAAFQTLILLSTSLKANNDSDNYWTTKPTLEELYKNDSLFKIYLGLLQQNAKKGDITFYSSNNPIKVSDLIDKSFSQVSNISKYRTLVKDISLKTQVLDAKIRHSKEITNDSLSFENYYSIVNSSIDLMKTIVKIESLPHFPSDLDIQEKSKEYLDVAQTASDIVVDVSRRNYASAIVNTTYLFDTIFKDQANEDTRKALFKYGSFMATIAQADSSDEVEKAIEAFALPAGSSRIKRQTAFNVSLNAYCGLFTGIENIKGVDDGEWNSYGVTAPIGFSISKGHSVLFFNTPKKGWSSSLFFSVVDLGAIAAFRFTDDKAERVPDIELKDIVSPGVFYSLGIPKSPISINAGWQVGPLLRKVNLDENTFGKSYSRFSLSIVVDIPILNLYTKSSKN